MSRLNSEMSYRDLCRAYFGREATDAECDYAWWFVAGFPSEIEWCEDRLATFARGLDDPLVSLRRKRAEDIANTEAVFRSQDARLAKMREQFQ